MDSLRALQGREQVKRTRYSPAARSFVYREARVRGLLRVLGKAFPPQEHTPDDCARCKACAEGTRKRAGSAALSARAALTPSKRRIKRGSFVPVASVDGRVEALPSLADPVARKDMWCRGATDTLHGQIVDENLRRYVSAGPGVLTDPCARNAVRYLEETKGLVIVASQVPFYSPTLRVCTACDVLCVDKDTRRNLYLVEIKATRTVTGTAREIDACYKVSRCRLRKDGPLGKLPHSRYMEHQLQLWAMWFTLRRDLSVPLAGAFVLRVGPAFAAEYPLCGALRPGTPADQALLEELESK